MIKHAIHLGETYAIRAIAKDSDGVATDFPAGWTAACRVTAKKIGGEVIANPTITFVGSVATATIDTGDEPWVAGVFWWDIRFTDPAGNDIWAEAVRLKIKRRNAPAS